MINIFDMMGPVMVGPSSSHTAGAARIGNMGRTLLGEEVARADIGLYGSFAETGYGHGTDRALLAGLLGMKPDDLRIPNAYEEANRAGMAYSFRTVELRDAHPNTALLELTGKSGKQLTLQASSIGGGAIVVNKIDGIDVNFTGDFNTLIVRNQDESGSVAAIRKERLIGWSLLHLPGPQLADQQHDQGLEDVVGGGKRSDERVAVGPGDHVDRHLANDEPGPVGPAH